MESLAELCWSDLSLSFAFLGHRKCQMDCEGLLGSSRQLHQMNRQMSQICFYGGLDEVVRLEE